MNVRIDTVIIGVHKCATTSLWEMLSQHPSIVTHSTGQLFGGYIEALESGIPADCLGGLYLNDNSGKTTLVRDTTLYDDPDSIARLKQLYPALKIILCVREPVARAFSAFVYAKNRGYEQRYATIDEAYIEYTGGEMPWRTPPLLNYFEQGLYYSWIGKILVHCELADFYVVDCDRLTGDPVSECNSIFGFLGLTNCKVEPVVANKRKAVKYKKLNSFLRGSKVFRQLARWVFSADMRATIYRYIVKKNVDHDRSGNLSENLEIELKRYYADDWSSTKQLLQRESP